MNRLLQLPALLRVRWNRLRRGRRPHPLERELTLVGKSGLMHELWYLERYPDVAAAGMDPVEHYLRHGWKEGRDPGPQFSTNAYLSSNPDVAAAGGNPLLHYIEFGRMEGRSLDPSDYTAWARTFDTLTVEDRNEFRKVLALFPLRPRISVVMPVYNTERRWLEPAIESVLAQIYPFWQLCISDNASTLPEVREVLAEYARKDPRISVTYRKTNEHICVNSNEALGMADGEFVALMDSDDILPEHALFWVAHEINEHPHADLIYSDEDKIDLDGKRFDHYFKPDWNPALILSQNMFSHLGVFRRSLVTAVGGFRTGLEGSQDHDLTIRCMERTEPARIRHVPRVLYHWRAIPGSAASTEGIGAKPYAWQAGVRAIEDHLRRTGIEGRVLPTLSQFYQVDYLLKAVPPKVSIIMPSACKLHLLRPCMEALLSRSTYPDFEVLLAVNEIRFRDPAQAAYLESLKGDPRVRVLVYQDRPFNFSWLNNWAIRQAAGSVLCLMNDDIEVITPDWLEKMVARARLDGVGAVGPMLYYPDDRIQHAGVILGMFGVAGHQYIGAPRGSAGYIGRAALEQDLSCVTAACMVLRREAFDQVKGFNEELAIAFNDVDLCIRLRNAGWRIIWTPQVEHYHHESASIGKHDSEERRAEFAREVQMMRDMWGPILDSDPFHNPNLSLRNYQIGLSSPPRISKLPQLPAVSENPGADTPARERNEAVPTPKFHFVQDYERHVANLLAAHSLDEAMSLAVGGDYRGTGLVQADLLEYLGLKSGMALFDLGCGSGRLSTALSQRMSIDYSGTDVVQSLLDYAKSKAPAGYRFQLHRELSIPEADASFDFTTAFSVFTHLLHEESYIYLEHMKRVLRPGGTLVFSFLEFAAPRHWSVFEATVSAKKAGALAHLNIFIERPVIECWALKLGMKIDRFIGDSEAPWIGRPLGQAIAVLRKPLG